MGSARWWERAATRLGWRLHARELGQVSARCGPCTDEWRESVHRLGCTEEKGVVSVGPAKEKEERGWPEMKKKKRKGKKNCD